MGEHKDQTGADAQVLAERRYAALREAVIQAGFHALDVVVQQNFDQLTCTEKYRKRYGYTGIIFFITEVNGGWYLATPHPYHYHVRDPTKVAKVVVSFLGARRRKKQQAKAEAIDLRKELRQIDDEEYERAVLKCRIHSMTPSCLPEQGDKSAS